MSSPTRWSLIEPLGHRERRLWKPNPGAMGGRVARRGGSYEVFVPAEIAERRFALDEDVVATVASATTALARLNSAEPRLTSLNALASALLRSESTASSRLEGLSISQKRLARAAFEDSDRRGKDSTAAEILGNVKAMRQAVALGVSGKEVSIDDICDIHRTLLRFSVDRKIAGEIRTQQNWIGANPFSPVGAVYVPPPPEHVHRLLDDLCRFIARDDIAPIVQAAIAHAQFENIHPFADGNGRVGRALIHTVLRRGGEALNYVPPISLVLGATQQSYAAGFGEFSGGDVSGWCDLFAAATERATREAERMASKIDNRQVQWLERLGNPRRDAVVHQLIANLPGQPVIDVAAGCRLTGKSYVTVNNGLLQMEEAGIVRRLNEKKWGRVWECDELLDLVEEFEESVTSAY
ncbi:MAG TPA: Fic family protein [Solirubrobacterales bacterium]